MNQRCLLGLVSLLLACRGSELPPATGAHRIEPTGTAASRTDPELLRTLSILVTRHAPSAGELANLRHQFDTGQLTMPHYLDSLLATPEFAKEVAPLVIFRGLLSIDTDFAGYNLNHTNDPSPIYYLAAPCKPATALTVRAWWNLDEDVKICPDSYKPEKWQGDTKKSEPKLACLSYEAADTTRNCGCGPNLIRCYPSKDRRNELRRAMLDEIRQTVAYVVSHDMPIDQMFLANETARNRDVESFQRRQIIESRQAANLETLRELDAWPAEGKWAPREELAPGEHAGLLTAPQIMNFLPDLRQRMNILYDVLWCSETSAAGATPELVSKIAGASANFQLNQDHWKELAGRPICTTCHARLDYGLQFFKGFGNIYVQGYFAPAMQRTSRGPLFGRDIDDPRGEADLNPHAFVTAAVAQPEHRRCLASDFAGYALGGKSTVAAVDKLAAQVTPGTTARELMRAALLTLVEQWEVTATGSQPPGATSEVAAGDITIPAAVRGQLAEHCTDCHDNTDPTIPDLSKTTLPRATVVKMLDAVAFGSMPKDGPLPPADRAALLEPLIVSAWSGPDAATARDYFVGRMVALSAYQPDVIFNLVHRHAGADGSKDWRMMERAIRPNMQQSTVGLFTVVGLEAIESCKEHNKTRADIDKCITASLRLEDIAIDNAPK